MSDKSTLYLEKAAELLGMTSQPVPDVASAVMSSSEDVVVSGGQLLLARQDLTQCVGVDGRVNVIGRTSVDHASMVDPSLIELGHRDHYQFIPGEHRAQYAAAEFEFVSVRECLMYSPWSMMQGLFMSDGFIRDAEFVGNTIEVGSPHKIAVCVMDGIFAENVDANGWPVPVHLTALRIAGGGLKRIPIKVVSFQDEEDVFAPAYPMVGDRSVEVVDDRTSLPDTHICLADFDLRGFREAAAKVETHVHVDESDVHGTPVGWRVMCEQFYDLALEHGRQVERSVGVYS